MSTIPVNPSFRLDVTGELFLNKDTNIDVQDTLVFNRLFTRLSIEKGRLALFPNTGLKQHLYKFNFVDKEELATAVQEFEDDVKEQMAQDCTISYTLDTDNKYVHMTFELENLKYNVEFVYENVNNSIKIINYTFVD
jgi:hypothetical protein